MPLPLFILVLAVLVGANLVYPLGQALSTGGVVYFTDASDETSYLQYDFARAMASPARPGEYLVVGLHQLGLSGGWQNFLLDALVPLALAWGLYALFCRLGFDAARARLAALAMLVLPQVVGATNPPLHSLSFRLQLINGFAWLNMVTQHTVAVLRTPEPQLSCLILVVVALLAVRWRSAWPVLLVLPFMYTFLAVPAGFVAGAWQLRRWWGDRPGKTVGPLLLTWIGIGLACGAYFRLKAHTTLHLFLISGHLPWVSLSSLMALAIYAVVRPAIRPEWRFLAVAAALAPLAATNQNVISGYAVSPVDFEDYGGVFACALVGVMGAGAWPRAYPAMVALGCAIWLWVAGVEARETMRVNAQLPFDRALATALREDSRHVAINDRDLTSNLALVYPKQPTTALGFEQGNPFIAPKYVAEYRCIRQRILHDHPHDPGFFRTLLLVDDIYLRPNQIYVATMQRGLPLEPPVDIFHGCEPANDRPLRYFLVKP